MSSSSPKKSIVISKEPVVTLKKLTSPKKPTKLTKSSSKISFKIDVFDQNNKVVSSFQLNPDVWTTPMHKLLISRATVMELANKRQASKKTKNRGEVSGGGRKPWRQKGTGRARAGSIRSPIWRGGGVTFGPTGNENYTKSMNKKEKKKAFLGCLNQLFLNQKIFVVDLPILAEPKTKKWLEICKNWKLNVQKGLVLVAFNQDQENWIRSFANFANHKAASSRHLRFADLIRAEKLILDRSSLIELEKRLIVSHD